MTLQFDHIAQQVPDIAAAVAWYTASIPGAKVLYQDKTWAMISAGDVKLAFVQPQQHPSHIAWRVGWSEVDGMAAACGASVKEHRDRSRGFYLKGPGDLCIEFIAYPPDRPQA